MIEVKLTITEIGGRVQLKASGGNVGGTSKMERDFTRKLLTHINRFNTTYKNIHRGNRVKMRALAR
jgi:hypothetical protein